MLGPRIGVKPLRHRVNKNGRLTLNEPLVTFDSPTRNCKGAVLACYFCRGIRRVGCVGAIHGFRQPILMYDFGQGSMLQVLVLSWQYVARAVRICLVLLVSKDQLDILHL